MTSIILSNDYNEIEKFRSKENNKYIIIDSTILSDEIFNTKISKLIIGETPYYSDTFINKIIEIAKNNNAIVRNYHIYSNKNKGALKNIKIPIIFVTSLLPNMGKRKIAFSLYEELHKYSDNILIVSSNQIDSEFSYEVFPFHLFKERENPILEINHWFYNKVKEYCADYCIVSIPGGIVESVKYNNYNDYGFLNYAISRALTPQYIICSIFDNISLTDNLPNVFQKYNIDKYLYINKILDQNQYDFNLKENTLTIENSACQNFSNIRFYEQIENIAKHVITL